MQRWLLLVHQLPAHPSNLRVRTWRRLQQLGAVALKQAVYVLPHSPGAREDFEWLRAEIQSAGGDATVFAAEALEEGGDAALGDELRRARQADYTALAKEIQHAAGHRSVNRSSRSRPAPRLRKNFERFRQRFAAIERVDFFGSPGRDRVLALLAELDTGAAARRDSGRQPSGPAGQYRRRLWVTRPRPGIDRIGSAWLIGRFIDPDARFGFAADAKAAPADAVPFDMFGVEFSHHADRCTFETLCERFGIRDGAVTRGHRPRSRFEGRPLRRAGGSHRRRRH
jgi:hypothetical protein